MAINRPRVNRLASTRTFISLILILFLSACGASFRDNDGVHPNPSATPWGSFSVESFSLSSADSDGQSAIQTSAVGKPPKNTGSPAFDILVLSGGGSRGSYAAGILRGWTEKGTRPSFDVVTGISTGSLVSAMAFAGPKYDDLMKTVYTELETGDILENNFLGVLAGGNSLATLKPLKKLLNQYVDESFLADIAVEHRKGRRLYVGTTNLDTGTLTIWDMGAIADSGRNDALERFRTVLLASSSIPVWFEPVLFRLDQPGQDGGVDDGAVTVEEGRGNLSGNSGGGVDAGESKASSGEYFQIHADGGVTAPLFLNEVLARIRGENRNLIRGKINVNVVMSGKLTRGHGHPAPAATLKGVAAATVDALYQQLTLTSVYRVYVISKNAGANFRITAIPDDFELLKNSVEFDPDESSRLYSLGKTRMRNGTAWSSVPPHVTPLERIN